MCYVLLGREQLHGLVYSQGVLDAEDAATAALKAVQMCSASEGFPQITGKGADICSLRASDADHCARQTESGVVCDIDSP